MTPMIRTDIRPTLDLARLLEAGQDMAELLADCAQEAVQASGDIMDGAIYRACIAAWQEAVLGLPVSTSSQEPAAGACSRAPSRPPGSVP